MALSPASTAWRCPFFRSHDTLELGAHTHTHTHGQSSLFFGRGADWAPPGGPEDDALLAFLDGGALDDGELAFLGYRLLLAAPFPAVVARRYGFLASASVGGLLEAVRAQDVRPLCESWAAWADARLRGIAVTWKAALAALP